ncbi:MAG TPA: TatD family hydrolase [Candidatus Limnocylindrales bacterium]|nr:TatD family hydrolase [Candidatus Limnocylindrales bacterium]
MIDSHAHIGREEFDADRGPVIERARAAGIRRIVEAGTDAASSRTAITLARRQPLVRAAVGFHPCDVRAERMAEMDEIEALAMEPEVVAIGETGLDFHWPENAPPEVQEEFLRRHIAIAKKTGKPLVLHHRGAGTRVAEVLEREGPPPAGGTFHCFAGDLELARRVIALGMKIGVGGSATFKKSVLPGIVRELDLRQVVLETDSPYLAPVPHRGKRNEPAYLALVRDQMASALGITPDALEAATDAAASALFRF